jgi:hypothetical protein
MRYHLAINNNGVAKNPKFLKRIDYLAVRLERAVSRILAAHHNVSLVKMAECIGYVAASLFRVNKVVYNSHTV